MARVRFWRRFPLALILFASLAGALLSQPAAAQQTPPSILPPPPFEGPAPRPGDVALLRTSRAVTPSDLSAGLTLAGCTPTVIAITVGGQWQVFVAAPAAPSFVNAPFLATVPTLAAGTGFFVRCEPAPLPTGLTLAPIESVEVVRSDSATPSYWAVVTSGLPSGCAKFERIDSSRSGDLFTMTVLNRIPQTLVACPAIYGFVTNRVPLTGDLVIGRAYTLRVNDQTTTFVAGSASIRVGGPPAPTNVRLSGPLADTDLLVPAGEAERGRVSVLWDAPLPATAALTGFRIYERDCAGVPTGTRIEVEATARSFGPLQPCRPGGSVGVAAISAAGESSITWSR
ncbi:MAG: hypothetical protein EPO16_06805 [Dehalococcoidia bacterium]|nr:MAG: hypothetical protein EPO16_06805 [Dehalococcoidia bacterium]